MSLLSDWLSNKTMTQISLSKIMNVSRAYISEYCKEEKRMRMVTTERFAKALNLTVIEFLVGPPKNQPIPQRTEIPILTPQDNERRKINEIIEDIDDFDTLILIKRFAAYKKNIYLLKEE